MATVSRYQLMEYMPLRYMAMPTKDNPVFRAIDTQHACIVWIRVPFLLGICLGQ